jgi:hypothetical protein
MEDKRNADRDEQVSGPGSEEKIRGVASDDEEFEDAEDLDEDEAEDEEGSNTF